MAQWPTPAALCCTQSGEAQPQNKRLPHRLRRRFCRFGCASIAEAFDAVRYLEGRSVQAKPAFSLSLCF